MTIIEKSLIQSLKAQYKSASAEATKRRKQMQQLKNRSRHSTTQAQAFRLMKEALDLYEQNKDSSPDRRLLHLAHCFAKGRAYGQCETNPKTKVEHRWIADLFEDLEDDMGWALQLWIENPTKTRHDILGEWGEACWTCKETKGKANLLRRQAASCNVRGEANLNKAMALQAEADGAARAFHDAQRALITLEANAVG